MQLISVHISRWPILILILLWSCSIKGNQDTAEINNVVDNTSSICKTCPRLLEGENAITFTQRVMRFVAKHVDKGNLMNELTDTFYRVPLNDFDVENYLNSFQRDEAVAKCGLTARIMTKILLENGIDAYTYNFGFSNYKNSHVLVLVKHQGELLIFDPYYNYSMTDVDSNPLGLFSWFKMVEDGSLNFLTQSDSVATELLIRTTDLSKKHRRLMDSDVFTRCFFNKNVLNDSLVKYQYYRCYNCAFDCYQFNSIRDFEAKLKAETSLSTFHEGMVMKLSPVEGASDAKIMDAKIDSVLLKSNLAIWKDN